jgi:hypothetical protein
LGWWLRSCRSRDRIGSFRARWARCWNLTLNFGSNEWWHKFATLEWRSSVKPIRSSLVCVVVILLAVATDAHSQSTVTFATIDFWVYTGGDDLRSSSHAQAMIVVNGSPQIQLGDMNGGKGWEENSLHEAVFTLPQPLTLRIPPKAPYPISLITIGLLQGSCFGCTTDNWNMDGLVVRLLDRPPKEGLPAHSICLLSSGYFGPGNRGSNTAGVHRFMGGALEAFQYLPTYTNGSENVISIPHQPPCVTQ